MKVKHLLFSSLFLSAGFAACTSDVEEFNTQAPSTPVKGYEMKDLKISVTNGEFEADAETRAELSEKWAASWQEGDRLGAAWYSMASIGKDEEDNPVVTGVNNLYSNAGNKYASNTWFEFEEGTENEFASTATCMAGAYVLYYPYNSAITSGFTNVAVKTKNGIENNYDGLPTSMEFDCENPTAAVNKNIFAANVASFVPGGEELTEFTVKQIPNLYALTFKIKDEALLDLKKGVKILSVVMEATNGLGGAGETVLYSEGNVLPSNMTPNANQYNNAPVDPNDLTKGYQNIGTITFKGTKKADRFVIDASEATQDNAEYQIAALGKETSTYYFSALPVNSDVQSVTFSIIAQVGEETKIFARTYDDDSYTAWEDDNSEGGYGEGLKTKVTGTGKVVKLPIALDVEKANDKIYTVEQFVSLWNKAKESDADVTLDFGRPMDLRAYDLTGLKEGVKATIDGDSIIINNVEGKFVFNKDVRIKGNLTTTGASEFNAKITVEGNVQTDAATTFNTADIWGNVTANDEVTFVEEAVIGGTVGANANVTFSNKAKTGVITVAAEEELVAKNDKNDIAGINVKGAASVNGKIGAVKVEEAGTITSTNATTTSLTIVDGTVEAGVLTAEDVVDIQLEGKLNVSGALKVTGDDMKVAGNVTASVVNYIKKLTIGSTGNVNITGASYGDPVTQPVVETVEIKKGTNKTGELTVNTITLNTTTNEGKITVTKATFGTLTNNGLIEKGNSTITGIYNQNGTSTTGLTINEDATFNVNANTECNITNNGTVNVNATEIDDIYTPYVLTSSSITNNGIINIEGTLTEKVKDKLNNKLGATINVKEEGTLNVNASSSGANIVGVVMVENGANVMNYTSCAFTWTGDVAPTDATKGLISTIYVDGVTSAKSYNVLKDYNLVFVGDLTLDGNLAMSSGKSVTIAEDAEIKSNNTSKKSFTINGTSNKILAGKSLTLTNVTLKGDTGAELNVEAGGKFNGTKDGTVTVKY